MFFIILICFICSIEKSLSLESDKQLVGNWILNINTGSGFQTDFEERDQLKIQQQQEKDQFSGSFITIDNRIQPLQSLNFDRSSNRLSFCRFDVS